MQSDVHGDKSGGARAASTLIDWLDELVRSASAGEIASTSAGAGPGRDYGYLHYRTHRGEHSILVFRSIPEREPEVHAFRCEASDEDVAPLVDQLTHGRLR